MTRLWRVNNIWRSLQWRSHLRVKANKKKLIRQRSLSVLGWRRCLFRHIVCGCHFYHNRVLRNAVLCFDLDNKFGDLESRQLQLSINRVDAIILFVAPGSSPRSDWHWRCVDALLASNDGSQASLTHFPNTRVQFPTHLNLSWLHYSDSWFHWLCWRQCNPIFLCDWDEI